MRAELLKGLTNEQIAKVKACKSQEELLVLAKEEGIELTDEQLEAVSGGCATTVVCPKCGSTNVYQSAQMSCYAYSCNECDFHWRSSDDLDSIRARM